MHSDCVKLEPWRGEGGIPPLKIFLKLQNEETTKQFFIVIHHCLTFLALFSHSFPLYFEAFFLGPHPGSKIPLT